MCVWLWMWIFFVSDVNSCRKCNWIFNWLYQRLNQRKLSVDRLFACTLQFISLGEMAKKRYNRLMICLMSVKEIHFQFQFKTNLTILNWKWINVPQSNLNRYFIMAVLMFIFCCCCCCCWYYHVLNVTIVCQFHAASFF